MSTTSCCEYPQCTETKYLTECKITYDTTALYCREHAFLGGYCSFCGYKLPLTISKQCESCHEKQRNALNYWTGVE